MKSIICTYFKDNCGAIAVEGALLLPLLLTIGLGGLDASNMLLQNHRLENQLSMASSYLARSDDPAARETAAKNLAVTGTLDGNAVSLIKNWTPSDITISYLKTNNTENADGATDYRGESVIETVQITSNVDYKGFGIISSLMPNSVTLTAQVQERVVGGGL